MHFMALLRVLVKWKEDITRQQGQVISMFYRIFRLNPEPSNAIYIKF